jgi:N-acetylglutamate synthase-like GNAT family acetyltransferase
MASNFLSMNDFILRPAEKQDQSVIRRLVIQGGINPTGLDFQRFWVTEADGAVIGCCQVKPHLDGSRELASLVVREDWRGKGVARALVEHFTAVEEDTLYLMCRSDLGEFYEKFGFRSLEVDEMPKYFQRVFKLMNTPAKLGGRDLHLLIMAWGKTESL